MSKNKLVLHVNNRFCSCVNGKYHLVDYGMPSSGVMWTVKCRECGHGIITKGWYIEFDNDDDTLIQRSLTRTESDLLDTIRSEYKGVVEQRFDDGFYWFNLETSSSSYEARLMKHCGKDERGTLWSLRDRDKRPHITATVTDDGIVVDLRARHNKRPRQKKYGKYVAALYNSGCVSAIADGI